MNDQLKALCDQAIQARIFPGCQLGYVRDGHITALPVGRFTYEAEAPAVTENVRYDVASITKSVPTSMAILKLAEEGRLGLDDPAVKYLPEMQQEEYRDEILIRHLLTFTVTFKQPGRMAEIAAGGAEAVLEAIWRAPLLYPPGTHYEYSNAPSLLLGLIAERISGRPLDELANEMFFEPLGMKQTTFRPETLGAGEVAPTEVNQRGTVQGQVHDEGAWALRQGERIPAHAGLFSTAGDLLKFAEMLLNNGELGGRRYFEPGTIKQMYTNQNPGLGDRAGLGWALRWPKEPGVPGSDQKFGKTGFTGTLMLMDPVTKIGLVHLSNRTYPQRDVEVWRRLWEWWGEVTKVVFAD